MATHDRQRVQAWLQRIETTVRVEGNSSSRQNGDSASNLYSMAFRLPSRKTAGTLRPLDIGRRLLRAVDEHIDIDVKGRRIAPNSFTVHVATPDREHLRNDERALINELVGAATTYIRDERLNVLSAISVDFLTDDSVEPGRCTVSAAITGQQPVEAASPDTDAPAATDPPIAAPTPTAAPQEVVSAEPPAPLPPPVISPAPEPITIAEAPAPVAPRLNLGALVASDGTRHPVGQQPVTLGRATESSVSVADGQASRRHAEIRYENGRHLINDLGSTNGTIVNGRVIQGAQALAHGDVITIGTSEFRYEAS